MTLQTMTDLQPNKSLQCGKTQKERGSKQEVMFPNVYCAMRKSVDGVGNVSDLGEMLERSVLNPLAIQQ